MSASSSSKFKREEKQKKLDEYGLSKEEQLNKEYCLSILNSYKSVASLQDLNDPYNKSVAASFQVVADLYSSIDEKSKLLERRENEKKKGLQDQKIRRSSISISKKRYIPVLVSESHSRNSVIIGDQNSDPGVLPKSLGLDTDQTSTKVVENNYSLWGEI